MRRVRGLPECRGQRQRAEQPEDAEVALPPSAVYQHGAYVLVDGLQPHL